MTAPGTERWRFQTDSTVRSSPTVCDGSEGPRPSGGRTQSGHTVFVGSADEHLYAVDADSGTQQWRFQTDDDVWSSPTVCDDTVFVGSQDGHLYAVDADSGTEQWRFQTDGPIGGSSPTVCGGTVFLGSWDHHLYALDAESGTEQWRFQTDYWVSSSPTVCDGSEGRRPSGGRTGSGHTVFVGSDDHHLYAVDADSGTQQWRFQTGYWVYSSPTVCDGTVFVGSGDGHLYALDAGTSSAASSEDSRVLLGTLGHHDHRHTTDPASAPRTGTRTRTSDTEVYDPPGKSASSHSDTPEDTGTGTEVYDPDPGPDSSTARCPHCGTDLGKLTAPSFCPDCGGELAFCSACGLGPLPGGAFCPDCGATLSGDQ